MSHRPDPSRGEIILYELSLQRTEGGNVIGLGLRDQPEQFLISDLHFPFIQDSLGSNLAGNR